MRVYALQDCFGMILTALPATFGHMPHHAPMIWTDPMKAVEARDAIPPGAQERSGPHRVVAITLQVGKTL